MMPFWRGRKVVLLKNCEIKKKIPHVPTKYSHLKDLASEFRTILCIIFMLFLTIDGGMLRDEI